MGNVPFTLFFMVCLLSYQSNVIGKPATDFDMKVIPGPCVEQLRTQNYCNERPEGYPSDNELRQLYKENRDKIDIHPQTNETGNRDDEKNQICAQKPYIADHVYMIRTEDKDIRYAFYLPGEFEMNISVMKCNDVANKKLEARYKKKNKKNIKCLQKSFQYTYVVLSRDMKRLESAKIYGIESSCDPVIQY